MVGIIYLRQILLILKENIFNELEINIAAAILSARQTIYVADINLLIS